MKRREFLEITTSAAAASVLAGCADDPLAPHPVFARPGAVTRTPLHIPPTVAPSGLTLSAAPGTADLGGNRSTTAWLYNGGFPGPTLVAARGDSVTVNFVNGLGQPWRGRVQTYEAIVKGEEIQPPRVPESFKVLIKELRSLGLNAEILDQNEEEIPLAEDDASGYLLPDLGGINLAGFED